MRRTAAIQGLIYVATGLWPIVHLRSFTAVTGPKPEGWLVKTLGGLITVVGAALLVASRERTIAPSMRLLGMGSALALAASDFNYAGKGRIAPIYFADGVLELALAAAWIQPAQSITGR
jgi:hypothetical protein